MKIEILMSIVTFAAAVIALTYAILTACKVLKFDEGTDKMKKIASAIRSGANAYLKRQYMKNSLVLPSHAEGTFISRTDCAL